MTTIGPSRSGGRGRRRTVGVGLWVAVVLAAAVLPATTAAAAAPSASVGPTTGLRKGDTVTASGSGFTPGDTVVIAQCSPGGCAFVAPGQGPVPANFAVASVAPDGTLSGSIRVTPAVQGHPCRPTGCSVRVTALLDGPGSPTVVSDQPITFVAPTPAVTLSPAGPLLEGHDVRVRATGVDAGAGYRVATCFGATVTTCAGGGGEPDPAPYPAEQHASAVADVYDIARARLKLRRTPTIAGAVRDCTTGACRVAVISPAGGIVASTPVTFAPTGSYVWPPATVTVTPTSGITESTWVTVRATGLDPWVGIEGPRATIDVCRNVPPPGPGPGNCLPGIVLDPVLGVTRFAVVDVTAEGTGTGAVQVPRRLPVTGGSVDCAVVGCTVAVSQQSFAEGEPRSNRVPVSFAPEWQPWATVDAFLAQGVEAVRGAPLTAAARSQLVDDLTTRRVLRNDALVAATAGPSDATVGEVARLYRAFFGRSVDTGGLGYWSERLRSGATPASVARAFGGTPEFRAAYDGLTNGAVVDRAYANTLGRAPDAAGRAYWVDRLDRGLARPTFILHIARSPELRTREATRVRVTQLTWGLLGRAPTATDLARQPSRLVDVLVETGQLPRP